ncbi:MAG: tRNA (adenosine(37)-N6)-threonylcarbamoyltransferase complex dimerization subunit type 1 TsaB [Planctomycetes bacterium B3_Pla]|nr:MAG: tRNA (adenosine(37)-N6)-threonylcarbamoyltransferase complex dimerization subunit type 1 TsaB [Planctomycetes bacterium B3_Pla]
MGNTIKDNLILAVETSSRIGSVAIAAGGEVLAEATFSVPLRHSAEIFTAIRDLLDRFGRRPREVEQVHISAGPGSFTGLRIAATFAKTMHLANAARIVAVDTLDVIAANVIDLADEDTYPASDPDLQAIGHERVAAIVDAKRGQFFIAVYERRTPGGQQVAAGCGWVKVGSDSLMSAEQFLTEFVLEEKPIWLLGDGLLYYKDKFQADGIRFFDERYWSPRAGKVHLLGRQMALKGQFADPVTLTPNYLRRPDVKIKTF